MIQTYYNLFISSTFIDMDVERDVIKFEVIPALNQMFKKKGVVLQAIDLRYGVNTSGLTEEEATDKVLNMCVNSIDRARPFFIGFVGNRYGSIPSPERWQDFYQQLNREQKVKLQGITGMSITEMEILYSGIFSDEAKNYRYLFFVRDEINKEEIPEKYRLNYENEEEFEKRQKNKDLRTKIECRCNEIRNSRCFPYSIKCRDNKLYSPGLAQKLIDEIANLINDELKDRMVAPDKQPNWLVEGNEVRSRMFNLAQMSKRRPDIERGIEMMGGSTLIFGPSFSGRSTQLAQLYLKYFEEDWNQPDDKRKILLAAVINHSQYSRNIYQIMGRWVVELSMLINVPLEDKLKVALVEALPENHTAIREMFNAAVNIIHSAGHSIYIFIDDLDQFLLSSPGDEKLEWVDDRVTVYATVNHESVDASDIMNLPFGIISISNLIEDPDHVFLNAIKNQNFCELPDSISNRIVGMEYTFLEVNTFFKMIRLFNKDDFKEMRLNNKLEEGKVFELFHSLPQDYKALFEQFVEFFVTRVGSRQKYTKLIQLLRDHPEGLCVGEIISFMNNEISAPEVYNMLYYFDDFVSIEYDTEIVKLRNHPALFKSYLIKLKRQRLEENILEHASYYRIPQAMQSCCELIGVPMPTEIDEIVDMIERYPDEFNADNITSFVINAYLSMIYKKMEDIKNADLIANTALLIASNMGDKMDVCKGHIYWAKAVMLKDAAQYSKAKEAGVHALDIFERNRIVYSDLSDLYLIVGALFENDADYKVAAGYYQTALKIMKTTNRHNPEFIESLTQHIHQILN